MTAGIVAGPPHDSGEDKMGKENGWMNDGWTCEVVLIVSGPVFLERC